jgi:hypothetical protein
LAIFQQASKRGLREFCVKLFALYP